VQEKMILSKIWHASFKRLALSPSSELEIHGFASILIKNIYILYGRKHFLLPAIYFSTNLVYPFTLRLRSFNVKT